MDAQRFKEAYERLELLDERLTHRVRPRPGGALTRPTAEQLEGELRELAGYTVEIKEVLKELFLSIGGGAKKSAAPNA
jgi:hypothetical protein